MEVREGSLGVRLLPIQRSLKWLPLRDVEKSRVTTYRASSYGGWHWGMRASPQGNTVYRLRGDHGVELVLAGGQRVFVGSQRPAELQDAITKQAR